MVEESIEATPDVLVVAPWGVPRIEGDVAPDIMVRSDTSSELEVVEGDVAPDVMVRELEVVEGDASAEVEESIEATPDVLVVAML